MGRWLKLQFHLAMCSTNWGNNFEANYSNEYRGVHAHSRMARIFMDLTQEVVGPCMQNTLGLFRCIHPAGWLGYSWIWHWKYWAHTCRVPPKTHVCNWEELCDFVLAQSYQCWTTQPLSGIDPSPRPSQSGTFGNMLERPTSTISPTCHFWHKIFVDFFLQN